MHPNVSANIILIGMPGAGKSTIGLLLAQKLAYPFVDTDKLIEAAEGETLQAIVDQRGHLALRAIEEKILSALNYRAHLIATGGSAVYSQVAMARLKQLGTIIYLQLDFSLLEQRIGNFSARGLVRRKDQSLADLYRERVPLYERYADIAINCDGKSPEVIATAIIEAVGKE
ncbi:MAG: shikimate kinase [Spongiibacteraceae bacterium]